MTLRKGPRPDKASKVADFKASAEAQGLEAEAGSGDQAAGQSSFQEAEAGVADLGRVREVRKELARSGARSA
jgi:hypothetical protein